MTQATTDSTTKAEHVGDDLRELRAEIAHLSGAITEDLARALVSGQELDELLQRLVLSQADQAASQAYGQAFNAVGSAGEALVGSALGFGASGLSNIFNVSISAPDPNAFRSSQTQLAATLARAVSRGQRGL